MLAELCPLNYAQLYSLAWSSGLSDLFVCDRRFCSPLQFDVPSVRRFAWVLALRFGRGLGDSQPRMG